MTEQRTVRSEALQELHIHIHIHNHNHSLLMKKPRKKENMANGNAMKSSLPAVCLRARV